jgi:AcrR family transcriptional regulator
MILWRIILNTNDGIFVMKKIRSKTQHTTLSSVKCRIPDASSKDKLFRSAEELFSTKRYREVSVRDIAARAGVNFGLVAYYFGGKRALFDEVFRSHVAPLVEEGMEKLKTIMHKGRKPSVEEILEAWILPCLRQGNQKEGRMIHLRIIANLSHERWEYTKEVSSYMKHSHSAFIKALHSCLPHLSKKTLMWRLHFVSGALFFGIRQPASLIALSGGRCNPEDLEETFDQILPCAAAAFRAPECAGVKSRKP